MRQTDIKPVVLGLIISFACLDEQGYNAVPALPAPHIVARVTIRQRCLAQYRVLVENVLDLFRYRHQPLLNLRERLMLWPDNGRQKVSDVLHSFWGFVIYRHLPSPSFR
jgi:hypothetical protein